MCFSATASLSVSGLLAFAAVLAQIKARTRAMQVFGLIPFIFAVQQAAEGFLWYLPPTSFWYKPSAYIFLSGAALWPFFIPFCIWLIEKQTKRRKMLLVVMLAGALLCVSALAYIFYYGISARISGAHILYIFNHGLGDSYNWIRFVYVALVALPPFISSARHMWLFGIGVISSFIAAHVWYLTHFTSIWCFFAAILSSLVLYVVSSE